LDHFLDYESANHCNKLTACHSHFRPQSPVSRLSFHCVKVEMCAASCIGTSQSYCLGAENE
jgi:hypothetical protein